MQHRLLLVVAALPLTLLPAEDAVRFEPADGLVLEKTQAFKIDVSLTSADVVVNGEAQDQGDVDLAISFQSDVTVRDRYVETDGARVGVLERTYVAAAGTTHISGPEDAELPETTGLEGRTVRFSWSADEESYSAEFTEGEQDAELLEDLQPTIDLEALLPDGDVEEGATWSVDVAHARTMFEPFGDLHLESENEPDDDLPWGDLMDEALDAAEGEFEATLAALGGDGPTARITFKIDCEGTASGETTVEGRGPEGPVEVALGRTATMRLELEGTLVWDTDAHHFRSFEWTATLGVTQAETQKLSIGDQDIDVEIERILDGSGELSITAERAGDE